MEPPGQTVPTPRRGRPHASGHRLSSSRSDPRAKQAMCGHQATSGREREYLALNGHTHGLRTRNAPEHVLPNKKYIMQSRTGLH
jgi:hypothetical protein